MDASDEFRRLEPRVPSASAPSPRLRPIHGPGAPVGFGGVGRTATVLDVAPAPTIGNTTNRGGLVVRARIDRRRCPIGKKVSVKAFRALRIERDDFHDEWNYVIKPRKEDQ